MTSGGAVKLQPHARGGLVHQVDGLVGQETVADIAVGQADGGLRSASSAFYLVMRLVAAAQALENSQRLFRAARLPGQAGSALQRGVLSMFLRYSSKVVARLQLAAGESGLRMAASMLPSALPAPTSVWNSSIKRITFPLFHILDGILSRSSNLPRYLLPAIMLPRSRDRMRLPVSVPGNLAGHDYLARPSTMLFAHARLTDELVRRLMHLHDAFNVLRHWSSSPSCAASSGRGCIFPARCLRPFLLAVTRKRLRRRRADLTSAW